MCCIFLLNRKIFVGGLSWETSQGKQVVSVKSLIKFEAYSFFTPCSRTENLLWKVGRGLGLCYHARSSYQEAPVGYDSDVDYIWLCLCLWLAHGMGWRFTWSCSLWKGVRFRDLQRSYCSSVCGHPGTSHTGQQNSKFDFRWQLVLVFVYCRFPLVQIDPKPATQKSATQPVSCIHTLEWRIFYVAPWGNRLILTYETKCVVLLWGTKVECHVPIIITHNPSLTPLIS